jgi:hypothetical protein
MIEVKNIRIPLGDTVSESWDSLRQQLIASSPLAQLPLIEATMMSAFIGGARAALHVMGQVASEDVNEEQFLMALEACREDLLQLTIKAMAKAEEA